MATTAAMLRRVWFGLLFLCGCGHHEQQHVTSDGMVIIGSSGTSREYAAAMFNEDYVLAEKLATQFVDENPNDANGYIAVAHAQALRGNLSDATSNYDKAIELDPQNAIALYSRGLMAQEQEEFITAKRFYERTLAVDGDSPEGHYGMAAACEGLGLHPLVVHHAGKFLELQPDSPKAEDARDMIKVATDAMTNEPQL